MAETISNIALVFATVAFAAMTIKFITAANLMFKDIDANKKS